MKDLTPQEAVKEARKIVCFKGAMVIVRYEVDWHKSGSNWLLQVFYDSDDYCDGATQLTARGRTLRSCLAKLKKEVKP